ncbi:MAG: hypothetical protein P4L33_16865 [Capsulimonadaceae bacterium]|nr:hypothetical protein [Capsulimonadaceae bacterium]
MLVEVLDVVVVVVVVVEDDALDVLVVEFVRVPPALLVPPIMPSLPHPKATAANTPASR